MSKAKKEKPTAKVSKFVEWTGDNFTPATFYPASNVRSMRVVKSKKDSSEETPSD